ncbi:MAG: glycosyltransferase family 4 protein [Rikenellaceae bacterium]|jgi:glycosyltransferase involved in cell wall biosynthesis|nr:glycosyltransferase family 4 protein [Rikenellaceae bacterium]
MKVLHVFNELRFSGAEKMYVAAAPIFQAEGCELIAVATGRELGDYAPQFVEAGFDVRHMPAPRWRDWVGFIKYMIAVRRMVRKERIDVVHVHGYWLFGLGASGGNRVVVKSRHSVFRHRKLTWIYGWFTRWMSRNWFGITEHTIGDSVYRNERDYYFNKTVKINNWYDGRMFFPARNADEKQELRRRLDIPQESCVLISVGGCTANKNHHDIIRALPLIEAPVLYLHLGSGATEDEERRLADELGVAENVRFVGNVTDVRDYLVASDVFVMPSRLEGLGMAAVEALACGVPSIMYDSPGLRDLIHDDDNGFLVAHDFRLIAQRCNEIHRDPASVLASTVAARRFVEENFSMARNVPEICKLYGP